ncbi:MAG TPA: Holliday junction resolvase RuvX [Acidimicrobiia bacterium]
MARALGVDLGARRVGLALSDPAGVLATPRGVLERSGDPAADHRAIVALAREAGADTIVVGLPLSLSGDVGPAARAVLDEVQALRAEAGERMRVQTHDERFTTVVAERGLRASGTRRRRRRAVVDEAAATVMLQSYLDRGAAR